MTVQCEWFLLCSADACPAQNRQVGDMPRGINATVLYHSPQKYGQSPKPSSLSLLALLQSFLSSSVSAHHPSTSSSSSISHFSSKSSIFLLFLGGGGRGGGGGGVRRVECNGAMRRRVDLLVFASGDAIGEGRIENGALGCEEARLISSR